MNDAQLIDRLAGTDAFMADVPVPDEIWTPDVALREIERRTAMQTDERKVYEVGGEHGKPRRSSPRWLVPLIAGGAAVVIAIVALSFLLSGSDEPVPDVGNTTVPTTLPESAPMTPLEVGAALDTATLAGDWGKVRALYATNATFSIEIGEAFGGSQALVDAPLAVPFPPGRPIGVSYPTLNSFDWDADGVITGFDDIAASTMVSYALGTSPYNSCREVDAQNLICDESLEGPFWSNDFPLYSEIFTVADGLITHHVMDVSAGGAFTPDARFGPLTVEYEDWVRANRPDLNEGGALFEFLGKPLITPDTAEIHRQLIAEWVAQR